MTIDRCFCMLSAFKSIYLVIKFKEYFLFFILLLIVSIPNLVFTNCIMYFKRATSSSVMLVTVTCHPHKIKSLSQYHVLYS